MIGFYAAGAMGSGGGGGGDPHFASVGYLLHGEGANGGTTFTDSGPNGATINRSGTTSGGIITSTAWAQFGSASIYGPSGTGNRLQVPNGAAYRGAGGPWTFEASLYRTSASEQVLLDGNSNNSNTTGPAIYITSGGKLAVWDGSAGANRGGGGSTIPTGALTRIAVTWDGTNLRFYVEGSLEQTVGTFTNTWSTTSGPVLLANKASSPSQGYVGYVDEVRFTRVARYAGASYALAPGPFPDS